MKLMIAALMIVGAVLYWVGGQLPAEAVMTFAGVMCGIVASIPVSIGLLIALTRERAGPIQTDQEPHVVYWTVSEPDDGPPQLESGQTYIDA